MGRSAQAAVTIAKTAQQALTSHQFYRGFREIRVRLRSPITFEALAERECLGRAVRSAYRLVT